MEAISIENLTKKYKDLTAVDSLNLEIQEGELFSLLGVNGAGKTTTIKMLTCLTKPTNGDAYIMGNSVISSSNKVKMLIGISPQETAVAYNLTVRENLKLLCDIYKFDKSKTQQKIDDITREFHLENILSKKASKLSGGWQRRLSIAMAIIGEPKILFLDEPTLGLDVIARNELWGTIRKLKESMTIILTTHYMEEAEELSDHIAIMKDGHLLEVDTPDNIKGKTETARIEDAFIKIIKEND